MPAVTPDLGTGTTINFSSSFLTKILNVAWGGIHREAINSSTMDTTTAHTFLPADLYDPGELSVEMQFDTDSTPPITSAAESLTINWPDAETMIASGFLTDYEITAANEEIMTATATIKFTGPITF